MGLISTLREYSNFTNQVTLRILILDNLSTYFLILDLEIGLPFPSSSSQTCCNWFVLKTIPTTTKYQTNFFLIALQQSRPTFQTQCKAFIKTKAFCPARLSWEQNSFKGRCESMILSRENTHSQLKSIMLICITEEADS